VNYKEEEEEERGGKREETIIIGIWPDHFIGGTVKGDW